MRRLDGSRLFIARFTLPPSFVTMMLFVEEFWFEIFCFDFPLIFNRFCCLRAVGRKEEGGCRTEHIHMHAKVYK